MTITHFTLTMGLLPWTQSSEEFLRWHNTNRINFCLVGPSQCEQWAVHNFRYKKVRKHIFHFRLDDEWFPADAVPASKTVNVCDLSQESKAGLESKLFGTSHNKEKNRRKRKRETPLPPPPPPGLFWDLSLGSENPLLAERYLDGIKERNSERKKEVKCFGF